MKLVAIIAILCFFSCKSIERLAGSHLQTDLGVTGNVQVSEGVKNYISKSLHCEKSGEGKRVLLTGFGLFSSSRMNPEGELYNISGVIAGLVTSKDYWPAQVNTDTYRVPERFKNKYFAKLSHLNKSDHGGRVAQRQIEINGEKVTICSLVLDVVWDQAASLILYEASRFKPDVIIMGGLYGGDDAILEGGSINQATRYPGFDSDGRMIIDNQPVSTGGLDEAPVISPETRGVEHTIAMKWDSKRLASMIGPAVESIASPLPGHSGFGVKYGTDASLSNDYICNNVSYVVLHALKGISFSLAGEEISISGPRTEAHDEPGSEIKIQISR